jgi:hypothetical protein
MCSLLQVRSVFFRGVYIGGIDGGFWVGFRQNRVGLEVGNLLILDLEMLTFFWREFVCSTVMSRTRKS